jgi:hypothetical protein
MAFSTPIEILLPSRRSVSGEGEGQRRREATVHVDDHIDVRSMVGDPRVNPKPPPCVDPSAALDVF